MAPRLNFLPDALSKTLLEFQVEGVLFGISKNGRCLIGDEMGLGKTLQAISIAYYYKNEWPLLIVCPSSMRFPWIEEIEKWLPDIQPQEINLVQSGTDVSNIKMSKISIVGYGLLSHSSSRLLINCLKDMRFGVAVVDESHYMKNRKAARTKALVSVIKKAKRAVLLTGTPALARPEELYIQIDVLKASLLGSFSRFANRYCDAHTERVCGGKIQKWNTQGASNLEELHNILKSNVMIRRLKRQVLTQLPPKRRQRITFHLAESESKKQLGKVIEEFRSVCKKIRGSDSSQSQILMDKNPFFEMHRLVTVLYKQTGLSKISAVRQYIADILENTDKKFLVFAYHVDVMKAIEQEVVKKRVKYIRIAGDVPSVIRGSLVHQFQTDESTRVAILSILAASMGITLTAADHIVFTELHWTPGVMEQAEDRVHRIGQENSVLVQYLVAKGTMDEVLWRMLCNKVYVTTATLNGKVQGLDVEEASEGQSQLLEAFSAWVMEDEDEEVEEDGFLFTHSQKKRKQDSLQRSLMEFFHSPSTAKCRKTDIGKEWSDSQDSFSEKEQACETMEVTVESTSVPDTCILVDSDEDNSLRKTTKKTYKIGKKKSPELHQETSTVTASESQEVEWEFARELTKVNVGKTSEPAGPEVVDILSSYTRLLKRAKDGKFEKNVEGNKDGGIEGCLDTSKGEDSFNLGEDHKKIAQVAKDVENSVGNDCLIENTELKVRNSDSELEQPTNPAVCTVGGHASVHGSTISANEADCKLVVECVNSDVKEVKPVFSTATNVSEKQHNCSDSQPIAARNEFHLDSIKSPEIEPGPAVRMAPTSEENINDFKTWCCTLCTFNNNAFLRVCEMCETPRYKSRRKSTNSKCSTDEFVARKQRKILEKCSSPRNVSKKGKKGSEVILSGSEGSSCMETEDKMDLSVARSNSERLKGTPLILLKDAGKDKPPEHVSESQPQTQDEPDVQDKPETPDKLEISDKPEIPDKPEMQDKLEIPDKPEILDKSQTKFHAVKACDSISSDVDLFASESLNEEDSDEIITSSFEDEIMTSPCETGIETEFDDVTDDDWWVCTSCKNYNYDDASDLCEACGLKKPNKCIQDLVTGLEDDDDCWKCEDCGEFNFGSCVIRKCPKCCHGSDKHGKSLLERYKHLRHLIVNDEVGEGNTGIPDDRTQEHVGKQEVIENLMFRLSNYTDRVYLYDGDGEPLNCNVNIDDFDISNTTNTPAILTEPSNRKQIARLVRKWKSLQQRKRRMIRKAGMIFDDPYEAVEEIRMGREQKLCTTRFPSKEKLRCEVLEAAQEKNGIVRHCAKPKGRKTGSCLIEEKGEGTSEDVSKRNNTSWIQAVDENGRPLCLSCRGVVDTKNTDCLWDERFCSHRCKEDYQCRISGTRVRHQLFQDEKGVCQNCGCDAHELYRRIKLLPKVDRRSYLENTPFISLPVSLLNKIIVDPKEGMFWEADHVVAVVEGGGECDLENYRTLCVPCHRQVTAELRERLKTSRQKRKIAGIPDITSFFRS